MGGGQARGGRRLPVTDEGVWTLFSVVSGLPGWETQETAVHHDLVHIHRLERKVSRNMLTSLSPKFLLLPFFLSHAFG